MGDNRPAVYLEDSTPIFRASSLGGMCIRALVAARGGEVAEDPGAEAQVYMAEGNLHEDQILDDRLPALGIEAGFAPQLEVNLEVAGCKVRGHLDDIVKEHDRLLVCEVKSMSDNVFRIWLRQRWESQIGYSWQLSAYMHELGLPGILVAKNRNTGQINLFHVEEPPVSLEEIKQRVAQVEILYSLGQIPTCDSSKPWTCRYRMLHDDSPSWIEGEGVVVMGSEFENLLTNYDLWRERENEAREMREQFREQVLHELSLIGTHKAQTDGFRVTIRSQPNNRLNISKAKKLLGKRVVEAMSEETSDFLIVEKKGAR